MQGRREEPTGGVAVWSDSQALAGERHENQAGHGRRAEPSGGVALATSSIGEAREHSPAQVIVARHFMVGTTMPFIKTFCADRKTMIVGMAATTSDAMMM